MKTALAWLLVSATVPGCVRKQTGFGADDPSARLDAVVQASKEDNRSRIPDLIEQLESDDPAIRMLASRSLARMTGTDLGYRHDDPEWKRTEAVNRWVDWYAQGEAARAGMSPGRSTSYGEGS